MGAQHLPDPLALGADVLALAAGTSGSWDAEDRQLAAFLERGDRARSGGQTTG